ncbi:hypothetical protein [Synechococcus phage S-H25]|nr:hypothetical protein [Synechococcus phage S-H25]
MAVAIQKSSKINFYKFVQVKEPNSAAIKSNESAALASAINKNTQAINNIGATVNSLAKFASDLKRIGIAQVELQEKNRKKFDAKYTTPTRREGGGGGGIVEAVTSPASSIWDSLLNIFGSLFKMAVVAPMLEWISKPENKKKVQSVLETIKSVVEFIYKWAEWGVTNTIDGLYKLLSDDTSWWDKLTGLVQGLTGLGALLLGIRWLANPLKIVTDFGNVLKVFWNALKIGRGLLATRAAAFFGKAALGAMAIWVVTEGLMPRGGGSSSLIDHMDANGNIEGDPDFDAKTRGKPTKATLKKLGMEEDAKAQGYIPERARGGLVPQAANGGWISGPQSGYPVSLDGGRSTSFIGHGTEYVARKANGGAFVVPVNTPFTKRNPHLTQKRMGEAKSQGFKLPGFASGGNLNRQIYLHWTAGSYNHHAGPYHTTIQGDGKAYRYTGGDYDVRTGHTYNRNSNNVGLSVASMGGEAWKSYPPKDIQIESMMKEAASIATGWGWKPTDVTIKRVMTHAEAGSNKDGRRMHDNYGPVMWGGNGERWDWLHLKENDRPGTGGDKLRAMMKRFMGDPDAQEVPEAANSPSAGTRAGGGGGPRIRANEYNLLQRLVLAEAQGEGELGMALVARAVLNRAGFIQMGLVRPGMFNSKSGSVKDVIYGKNQFTPTTDGSIDKKYSESQLEAAKKAIELARNHGQLRARLEGEKNLTPELVDNLVAATGFRNYDAGAGIDPSQQKNETRYKNHTFNTAGNPNKLTATADISHEAGSAPGYLSMRSGGGDFDTPGSTNAPTRYTVGGITNRRDVDLFSSADHRTLLQQQATRQREETESLISRGIIRRTGSTSAGDLASTTEGRNATRQELLDNNRRIVAATAQTVLGQNIANQEIVAQAQSAVAETISIATGPKQPQFIPTGAASAVGGAIGGPIGAAIGGTTAAILNSTINPIKALFR